MKNNPSNKGVCIGINEGLAFIGIRLWVVIQATEGSVVAITCGSQQEVLKQYTTCRYCMYIVNHLLIVHLSCLGCASVVW